MELSKLKKTDTPSEWIKATGVTPTVKRNVARFMTKNPKGIVKTLHELQERDEYKTFFTTSFVGNRLTVKFYEATDEAKVLAYVHANTDWSEGEVSRAIDKIYDGRCPLSMASPSLDEDISSAIEDMQWDYELDPELELDNDEIFMDITTFFAY